MSETMIISSIKESLEKKGYFVSHSTLFSKNKFESLKKLFEEYAKKHPEKRRDLLDTPHFDEPKMFDYLLDPKVLNILEEFMGPNIGLWSSHFICKDAITGLHTPWHEDSYYWRGRLEPMTNIYTIWLALDHVNDDNGCMSVIPGSHLQEDAVYELTENGTFQNKIKDELIPIDKIKSIHLKPNQFSIHDAKLIHGAIANKSNKRRCGLTMRYFPLSSKFIESAPGNQNFKVYHARGENVANNKLIYVK